MKPILIFSAFIILFSKTLQSQPVIENVLFNYYTSPGDNDFENLFNIGTGLTQLTTNGITGGCLSTPPFMNWGNDNAVYCSKYVNSLFNITNTRISFLYDTIQINTTNFDRAVSVFLKPYADPNHYVIASIMHDKKIQIVTYSWVNNPVLLNLQHNHWYEFILNTTCITPMPSYQIGVYAIVNDLGISGQLPPVPVGSSSGSFYDSLLFVDDAIEVSFTGSAWGGAKFLDNFHFEGVKSADSCFVSSIQNPPNIHDPEVVVFNGILNITHANSVMKAEMYSSNGKMIFETLAYNGITSVNVAELKKGIYFIRLNDINRNFNFCKKVLIL